MEESRFYLQRIWNPESIVWNAEYKAMCISDYMAYDVVDFG